MVTTRPPVAHLAAIAILIMSLSLVTAQITPGLKLPDKGPAPVPLVPKKLSSLPSLPAAPARPSLPAIQTKQDASQKEKNSTAQAKAQDILHMFRNLGRSANIPALDTKYSATMEGM
jgi:hypothetical protein